MTISSRMQSGYAESVAGTAECEWKGQWARLGRALSSQAREGAGAGCGNRQEVNEHRYPAEDEEPDPREAQDWHREEQDHQRKPGSPVATEPVGFGFEDHHVGRFDNGARKAAAPATASAIREDSAEAFRSLATARATGFQGQHGRGVGYEPLRRGWCAWEGLKNVTGSTSADLVATSSNRTCPILRRYGSDHAHCGSYGPPG